LKNKECNICADSDEKYLCCVDEVGDTVKRMVRNFQLFERDQIKVYGFTMTQCYCLLELLKEDGQTMQDLSEHMNLNTSTMTRIVDKLVRDKYIHRERSEKDRRVVLANLTEEGKKAAGNLNGSIKDYYEVITKNLPKDRVEEVLEAVSLLMDAFEKANPNCC